MTQPQVEQDSHRYQSLRLEQSPARLPKPHWLKEGEYNDYRWVVVDDNPASPREPGTIRFDVVVFDPMRPNETCRLTDTQYSHLVDTVKRQSYAMRMGKYARITSGKHHQRITLSLINWVIWMIQNGVRRFSQLTREDFQAYTEAAIYGSSYVLMHSLRLAEYIKSLKEEGSPIPCIQRRTNIKPYLDAKRLLELAGIDPQRGFTDKATAYELLKLSKTEGFYLSPTQVNRLSKGPPSLQKLVPPALFCILQPWDCQWRMRHELPGDRIQFEPFNEFTSDIWSKEVGREQGRTKTAPVQQTMELIDHSLRWILDYAPILLDIRDKYDALIANRYCHTRKQYLLARLFAETAVPKGSSSPQLLNASARESVKDGICFGSAVFNYIPAACAVVIAAFSGRRHKEVLSVRVASPENDDCILQDTEGFWLETYIEKTIQDWVRTPCNEVVVAAVEILRRWSAPARALSLNVSLFQYKALIADQVYSFNLLRSLRRFVEFLDLTPMPDGNNWDFKPHELRRFFAITYFWRYQYGDLASLSHHLRHFDPVTTQIYVTEPETGAIFRHVNKDYTTTILTEAALGERNISGPFGERFKTITRKLYDHHRRLVKVVSPKLIRATIERYVEKSGRRLKAFKWGYCACGTQPQQLRTARCLGNAKSERAVAPDLSRSSFTICGDCPHHVTESVFEQFWQSEIALHEHAANDPNNGPILREASREHKEKLQRLYERSFKNSRPLEIFHGKPHQPETKGCNEGKD